MLCHILNQKSSCKLIICDRDMTTIASIVAWSRIFNISRKRSHTIIPLCHSLTRGCYRGHFFYQKQIHHNGNFYLYQKSNSPCSEAWKFDLDTTVMSIAFLDSRFSKEIRKLKLVEGRDVSLISVKVIHYSSKTRERTRFLTLDWSDA